MISIPYVFKPFCNSLQEDIALLSIMDHPESNNIRKMLIELLDTVRIKIAILHSQHQHKNPNVDSNTNIINAYYSLNLHVNSIINAIHSLCDKDLLSFCYCDLFLSYTIFLDAYSQLGIYYRLASTFPVNYLIYYQQEHQMRLANKKCI